MTKLVSKVQFKRSERGEFHKIAERSLDDTISLTLNYPWDTERSLASVELTCPSITIEHPTGTYLKIGPYFSGQFSLYFLDTNNNVYLKTAYSIDDTIVWIKAYFEQKGKLEGFEKYGFTLKADTHFRTNSFEYTFERKHIASFLLFPISFVSIIVLMCLLKYYERPENFSLSVTLGMALFFIAISSPTIYLFFDYLSSDKNGYLQISKGHDEFRYGSLNNIKLYNKKNITEISGYGVRNSRSPWSECEIFVITFNNREQIQFTSLLISGDKLRQKFPEQKFSDHKRFFPTVARV